MSELLAIQNKNEILKKELEEKDKNLLLAAQYGKTLLEQNADLHTQIEKMIQDYSHKIEGFQQENYSLSMKLEAKERVIKSLASEIESQDKLHTERDKTVTHKLESEIAELKKKLSGSETVIESLQMEISIQEEKSNSLQTLLEQSQRELQKASVVALSESGLGESTLELENQITSLRSDKQDLEKTVLELKTALKTADLNSKAKHAELERSLVELEEKECRLTSLFNEIERLKNENEELQMEIDQMKYAETDPRKKGNSLFAELEDNRQVLEKQLLSVTSKFSAAKNQCEMKSQQISKLKLHVASLLNMTTSRADLQYQQYLEDSLASAKSELNNFILKCKELEEKQQKQSLLQGDCGANCAKNIVSDNFLKHLYDESLAKVASLEEELRNQCFTKVYLNDEVLQLKRKLHHSEREIDSNRAQIIQLNVKIEELTSNKIEQEAVEANKETKVPVFIERLPSNKEEGSKVVEDLSKIEGSLKEKYIAVDRSRLPLQDKKSINDNNLAELSSSKWLNSQTAHKGTERKRPSFLNDDLKNTRRDTKKVGFALPENEEVLGDGCTASKLKQMPRPRKKMEAPLIKVTQDTEPTEECKVQ